MLDKAPCRYSSSAYRESRAGPNLHAMREINTVWATTANMGNDDEEAAATQLDSHVNMVVVGSHVPVFRQSGKSADVRHFSSNYSKLESIPSVDAAVIYDCPYNMNTYIPTVRNAVYDPMRYNLILPFIMHKAGLVTNNVIIIQTRIEDLLNKRH